MYLLKYIYRSSVRTPHDYQTFNCSLLVAYTCEHDSHGKVFFSGVSLVSKSVTVLSPRRIIFCFPSTQRRRNLKTQQSPVILDLCLRKTRARKSRDYHEVIISFSKCFSSTLKCKVGVFKFLRFEERFRKASCSWRISVNGGHNRKEESCIFKWLTRNRVDGRPSSFS